MARFSWSAREVSPLRDAVDHGRLFGSERLTAGHSRGCRPRNSDSCGFGTRRRETQPQSSAQIAYGVACADSSWRRNQRTRRAVRSTHSPVIGSADLTSRFRRSVPRSIRHLSLRRLGHRMQLVALSSVPTLRPLGAYPLFRRSRSIMAPGPESETRGPRYQIACRLWQPRPCCHLSWHLNKNP